MALPLSNFIFSNITEAWNKGGLFTKRTFRSRNIKLLNKKRKKKLKRKVVPFLYGGKKKKNLLLAFFFFVWILQNSSPPFARAYLSRGQDESLFHHRSKLPRVCLLYQCTSHQECSPLSPVCIHSCGCLQHRRKKYNKITQCSSFCWCSFLLHHSCSLLTISNK